MMTRVGSDCRLVKPSEEFLDSYLEACEESVGLSLRDGSLHDPAKFHQWKETIFRDYARSELGVGLPEGYVPSTTFWLVKGLDYIGTGNIRHSLTDSLKEFGGHIGYLIRPSKWNMGYGTLQLGFLLGEACRLGIDPALITCDLDNPASARVMVKNGARLVDVTRRTIDGEERMVCRYLAPTCSREPTPLGSPGRKGSLALPDR